MSDRVYIRDCVEFPVQCSDGGFIHPTFQAIHRSGSAPVERGNSMSRWVVTAMHSVLDISVGISKGFTLSIGFGLTIALRYKVWDSLHPEKRLTVISQDTVDPVSHFHL